MISVLPIQASTDLSNISNSFDPSGDEAPIDGAFVMALLQSGLSQQKIESLHGMMPENTAISVADGGNMTAKGGKSLPFVDGESSLGEILDIDMADLLTAEQLKLLPDMPADQVIDELQDILDPEQFAIFESAWERVCMLKDSSPELFNSIERFMQDFHKNITVSDKINIGGNPNLSLVADDMPDQDMQKIINEIDLVNKGNQLKSSFVEAVETAVNAVVKGAAMSTKGAEVVGQSLLGEKNVFSGKQTITQPLADIDNLISSRGVLNDTPVIAKSASDASNFTIDKPVSTAAWEKSIGERLTWMAQNKVSNAKLQLKPVDLGPIEVRVSVLDDVASVSFVAHHATTRDALDNSLPRLREMFNESGLNLAEADVQSGSPDSGQNDNDTEYSLSHANGEDNYGYIEELDVDENQQEIKRKVSLGLVDRFA